MLGRRRSPTLLSLPSREGRTEEKALDTQHPSNTESPEARWSRWRAEADAVPHPGPAIRFVLPDGLTREMILEQFKDLPE